LTAVPGEVATEVRLLGPTVRSAHCGRYATDSKVSVATFLKWRTSFLIANSGKTFLLKLQISKLVDFEVGKYCWILHLAVS
jgi:hypothetical protein